MIGQGAGAGQADALVVENLALVVGIGRDLVAGRDRLGLRLGEAGTARLVQIVEGDVVEAVAGRADFLIDLEAALQRAAVVGAERPVEGEVHVLGRQPRGVERAGAGAAGQKAAKPGREEERMRIMVLTRQGPRRVRRARIERWRREASWAFRSGPTIGMISQKKAK